MNQEKKELLFSNLKFIPQVSLLVGQKHSFKEAIDSLLKQIICQRQSCLEDNLCSNCQKLKDNCYFDLNWYKFSKDNIMKKQDVNNIINVLSHQSLENNNPRICVLETIEYSSSEASNIFLKFLENLPNKTFLIFTSENIESVLPTVRSRSQIINLISQENKNFNGFFDEDFESIKELINQFIDYDNKKDFNSNFFLIKKLLNLKEKNILFFQFLLLISQEKLIVLTRQNNVDGIKNSIVKDIVENWKNNNKIFLNNLIELTIQVINKFSKTKNINLSLLLNYFFISIYQGQENEC